MSSRDAPMPALTAKQRRFVEEYLLDMCAGKAAARAGYSNKTANQQGYLLLDHPGVIAAIDDAKSKRSDRLDVDADYVLQRLVEECNADLADLYDDETGDIKPIAQWPIVWRRGLVAGVEVEALFEGNGAERRQIGHVKKLRLSERIRRLELIGKHVAVNAFQEQHVVKGFDTLADRLERAMTRRVDVDVTSGPLRPAFPPRTFASEPQPSTQARQPLPAASAPPAPPKPYRPITAPDAAPWPTFNASASTEYDPLND